MISNCNVPFESRSSASPRASARTTVSTPPTLGAKKWLYRSNAIGGVLNSGRPEPSFFKEQSGLARCTTVDAVHEPCLRRQHMGFGMKHSLLTLRRQRDVLQFFSIGVKNCNTSRCRRKVSMLCFIPKPICWRRKQGSCTASTVVHLASPDCSLKKDGSGLPLFRTPPMALLLYSHFFAPSVGGVETVVLALARGLAELRDSNGTLQFEIILVTQTPVGKYDDHALPFRVIRRPGLVHLCRLIRKADVIHVAGPALAPLALGLLSRKPVVVEHHGFQTICPNGQLLIATTGTPCPGHFMAGRHAECLRCNSAQGWFASYKLWLFTFVRRFLCARAKANITPTQWLRGLLHLPRTTAIPHGLDAAEKATRQEPCSGVPMIAFMGRLVTTKGARLLFEAAKILREQHRSFELLIIGDGPERAPLDGTQLEAALAQVSAVVVPSLGGEVFGLVVVESMQRGLPVVSSDLGAFTELLDDAGLTFRTGDVKDLAATLSRLLDDLSFAAALGRRARQRALDFCNKSRMIEAHTGVYLEVCDFD